MHPGFTAVSGYQGHSPKDGTTAGHVKHEPNFNLYGYQPCRPTFISQEKLYEAAKHSPADKTALASPPPLLSKEGYSKPSSVIVENKGKDRADLSSHHHGGSITLGTAMSPRHQGVREKQGVMGAHANSTPSHSAAVSPRSPHHAYMHAQQRVQDAAYNMSVSARVSCSPVPANVPASMTKLGKMAMPRTQSPLRVASPQQLSAAIMQPMELPKDGARVAVVAAMQHRPAAMKLSPKSGAGRASPGRSPGAVYRSPPPGGVAPHSVTHPESSMAAAYCYSLIQQGLVPNPIYTQTNTTQASVKAAAQGQSWPGDSSHDASRMLSLAAAQMAAHQSKRSQKDNSVDGATGRKRLKTETSPMTTQETSLEMATNSYGVKPPYIVTTSVDSMGRASHTYMDSFKSFVENAVQSVFLQDQERERQREKGRSDKSPPSKYVSPPNLQPVVPPSSASTVPCTGASCSMTTTTTTAVTFTTQSTHVTMPRLTVSHTTAAPSPPSGQLIASSTPSAPTSSSSSIMDTINRVANGYTDTDSDTLSASSPPPPLKVDAAVSVASSSSSTATSVAVSSVQRGESHKMGKKAWLQRYSDEDRNTATQGDNPEGMEEEGKKEPLKDCYVNCSYISPTKEGVSKSPISMMRDLTGKTEDESTSSASESESQVSLSSYQLCCYGTLDLA